MEFTHAETIKLINAFKMYPILWDNKSLGYTDRKSKAHAWKAIAAEVGVHTEICKRKFDSLFASYRREKVKLIKSRGTGNPADYQTPKWRFWNSFKFLRGLDDEDEDPLGRGPEVDSVERKANSPWSTSRMLAHKHRKAAMPPLPPKPSAPAPVTSPQPTHAAKEEDEYTAIGITVEAKLRKMSYDQRLFAENIINQALYKGLLFQLTPLSEIRNTEFPAGYCPPKQQPEPPSKPPGGQRPSSKTEAWELPIKTRLSSGSDDSDSSDDGRPISKLRRS